MAAKELNVRIGEAGVDKLLADPRLPYITTDEALASGATLVRGQIVSYDATAKAVKAYDAKEGVFGIVVEDADATAGDIQATVYVSGVFNLDELADINSGVDVEALYAELRGLGLICRRPELAAD